MRALAPISEICARCFGVRHYFVTALIFDGRTSRPFSSPWSTPVMLNAYVGYRSDAVDQTRTLVDSAPGGARGVPTGTR
ncbi:MAG TPA: hypothetical protein VFG87_05395 [Amycolatopsis sp.]|nr:hypothetical protein [Amycolatopsis sp.]